VVYASLYASLLYIPGYTLYTTVSGVLPGYTVTTVHGAGRRSPGLNPEINKRIEASREPQDPKSVNSSMPLRAESFRSPGC